MGLFDQIHRVEHKYRLGRSNVLCTKLMKCERNGEVAFVRSYAQFVSPKREQTDIDKIWCRVSVLSVTRMKF
jgi:hypothetical protein